MENRCVTSVTPELIEDKCRGEMVATDCVIFENIIPYLSLPENTSMTLVVETLLMSLSDARSRVKTLENNIENLGARLETLEGN